MIGKDKLNISGEIDAVKIFDIFYRFEHKISITIWFFNCVIFSSQKKEKNLPLNCAISAVLKMTRIIWHREILDRKWFYLDYHWAVFYILLGKLLKFPL
jgi:hypothetical protein